MMTKVADRDDRRLLSMAERAMEMAISPFSSLKVGSAILAKDGRVFTGCNIENPSLMLTLCAERVALYKALSEGVREFEAIAVVSSFGSPILPCGVCRQVLFEFAPSLVVVVEEDAHIRSIPIGELLPHPFRYERR